jgi:hypothetical protein
MFPNRLADHRTKPLGFSNQQATLRKGAKCLFETFLGFLRKSVRRADAQLATVDTAAHFPQHEELTPKPEAVSTH